MGSATIRHDPVSQTRFVESHGVKERPILFSGPMVRAILEGRKTQTRRVVKHAIPDWIESFGYSCFTPSGSISGRGIHPTHGAAENHYPNPFGHPIHRLWVREKFSVWSGGMTDCGEEWDLVDGPLTEMDHGRHIEYAATSESFPERWRPSIHMPRWACRLQLEITGVRVERLQDISEEDAKAEGAVPLTSIGPGQRLSDGGTRTQLTSPYTIAFGSLWDSINFDRGFGWAFNPWVWVVEFRKVP